MALLSKLLVTLDKRHKVSTRFYDKLAADAAVPQTLKKKVALYMKGDKRVTADSLRKSVAKCMQAGGGFRFDNKGSNGYAFVVDDRQLEPPVSPTYSSPASTPKTPFKVGNATYNLEMDAALGNGSFASVYPIDHDKAIKVFHDSHVPVIDENLSEFVDAFKDTQVLDLLSKSTTFDNWAYSSNSSGRYRFIREVQPMGDRPPSRKAGYVMRRMDGSLKERFTRLPAAAFHEDQSYVRYIAVSEQLFKDARRILEKYKCSISCTDSRFVHGDIKLENVLYKESGDSATAYIHDWDGVFVYKTDTLTNEIRPYKRGGFMTPVSTHPFFAWYMDTLRFVDEGQDLIQVLKDDKANHMKLWNDMFIVSKVPHVHTYFKDMLNMFYEAEQGGYDGYIQKVFSQPVATVRAWVEKQLLYCDLYSYGVSLLFNYIMMEHVEIPRLVKELDDDSMVEFVHAKEKIEERLSPVYDIAAETVEQSLLHTPMTAVNATTRVSGGGAMSCSPDCNVAYSSNVAKLRSLKTKLGESIAKLSEAEKEQLTKSMQQAEKTIYFVPVAEDKNDAKN